MLASKFNFVSNFLSSNQLLWVKSMTKSKKTAKEPSRFSR